MEVSPSSDTAVSGGPTSVDQTGTPPDAAPLPLQKDCAADNPAAEPCEAAGEPPQSEQNPEAACSDDNVPCQDSFEWLVEFIEGYTEPRITAPAWSFLSLDTRLRIDMPPSEFLGSMQDELGAEALVDLGFVKQAADEVQLASLFNIEPPLFVRVNNEDRTVRFEHDGGLFGITRSALDLALERLSAEATLATQSLFVVSSADDADLIRALGLPAVTATGLESLRRTEVARLFPDDPRTDVAWRYHLVLVDFDIARLKNTPSATIANVIERLAAAVDVYGIDPGRRFAVCRPTDDEIEQLKLATTFEDAGQICQLIEAWGTNARRRKVDDWRIQSHRPATTYSAACVALRRALEQQDGFLRKLEVAAALPPYRAACQQSVLAKLAVAVDGTADAFDQLELIAASGYAEAFFESDPLLHAAEAVLAGKTPPPARELYAELSDTRQRCTNELRRLHRDRRFKR